MKKTEAGLNRHLALAEKHAVESALKAGAFLRSKFGKFKNLERKADSSLVTEADKGAEKIVLSILKKKFPQDEILGEESGLNKVAKKNLLKEAPLGSFRWHIDPLDGTTNFVHAFPMFCVSIGLEREDGTMAVGVIYNPMSKDLYVARAGNGAKKNGKSIHVSNTVTMADAVFSTGFSYRRDTYYEKELTNFSKVLKESRALRRIGSAALDLAFVSSGQFDGFWEQGLNSWDVAAGICILNEAGGRVTQINGKPYRVSDETILATNGVIHNSLVKALG